MTVRVRCLLGHGQVPMAAACLRSLLDHSVEPVALVLHEDGTLTPADRDLLASRLPGVSFVSRARADDEVAPSLARRPATRLFRQANPLALKLVDVAVLERSERVAYCDSDVLFLRTFSGLFPEPGPRLDAVFMSDYQNAYSVRSWDLALSRRLRLARRVNTGLFSVRRSAVDLDLVEWFLSRPRYRRTEPWVEQTCWALIAGGVATRLLDPAQIAFPFPGTDPRRLVGLHFIGPLRHSFESWSRTAAASEPGRSPIEVGTVAARRCGAGTLARTELRRLAARLMGR